MKKTKYWITAIAGVWMLANVTSCSDDPSAENYYTFTGETIKDYLDTRSDMFSTFIEVLERADLMKLMAIYGAYTCFPPTNEAFEEYFEEKGITSLDDLTDEDCDTIARTHLVSNMYATSDMSDGVITSPNMNRRYIEVSHGLDEDSNSVVILNRTAYIIYSMMDDSVVNGIMQPIDEVLENTNRMLPDVIADNPNVSLFSEALEATGLADSLYTYRDADYDPDEYSSYKYISHVNKEVATVPDTKDYGFTAFIPTDSVLREKYGVTTLEELYELACEKYDETYDDADDVHDFDHITDERNPLYRFLAYHIMDRKAQGWNYLTPRDNITIRTDVMNPVDWYETLLDHRMIKIEYLTVLRNQGPDELQQRYVNRRYERDNGYYISGAKITKSVEDEYDSDALNGRYFYIDDILAFDSQTQDIVFNTRIRMDISTVFPELETNMIRLNGDYTEDDPSDYDESGLYGRNYYFPDGYLKNVTSSGYFIYRRPHDWYDSFQGDEMNLFGNYDITFKLPPVPYEGDWQIRLGFAAESTRGIAQVYLDDEPQGIPIDMTLYLDDASILGSDFSTEFSSMTDSEKAADQKALKNKGYYRGMEGGWHDQSVHGGTKSIWCDQNNTYRKVLCTAHLSDDEDHYLRVRSVSTKQGNDNEFMLDYIELVPKSVYGVTGEGDMEDTL